MAVIVKGEISILIVDDNVEFGGYLKEQLDNDENMHVVGVAKDGLEAIEMITCLKPELMILDIIMPNLDGIGVLERISKYSHERKPSIIILTAIGQDLIIQKAIALGAEYYIMKPFEMDALISRIREIYKARYKDVLHLAKIASGADFSKSVKRDRMHDLELEVTGFIRNMGIPPHMAGYQYLRVAIMHSVQNSGVFSPVTKVLYPMVAEKFNTTPQKVERSIRNAIESAWARSNPDAVDSLFGYSVNYSKGKPTNSEFIAMIADKLRVGMSFK